MQAAYAPRVVDTRARLGQSLLAYMLGVTLIITLLPFQFEWPATRHLIWAAGDAFDVIANVLLFVPLGFLYRLARPKAQRASVLSVVCIGAAISAGIEALQLFEATRETAVVDVVANTAGAGLGAAAFGRLARSARLDGRVIGWLALELPLMGLVYLLVPLLWINSLASGGEALRAATTVLIGVFGASILGGLQRHYFGPSGAAEPRHTAALAAIWFVAGAFPMLATHPALLALGASAAGAFSWWQGRRPAAIAPNRRFEGPLLRSAALLYALYLVGVICAPLLGGVGAWRLSAGFPQIAAKQIEIMRLLELVAAFTLVGYMIAELRGRAVLRYRDAVPYLLGWGVCLAVLLEAVRGYHTGYGASAARGGLLVAATLYGGWMYHLQRDYVVRLLADNAARARPRNDDAIMTV